MIAERKTSNDGSVTLEKAAESLGISINRLQRWLEDNEWMIRGDFSCDVVQGQIECGNLVRNKTICVTTKGMVELWKAFPDDGFTKPIQSSADEAFPDIAF